MLTLEPAMAAPGYPWALIRPIELADGATLRLRPIRPDDESRLVELFHRLSPRTVYQRFFRAYDRLPQHWYRHFANVDYRTRLALVAEEQETSGLWLRAVTRYEPGETPGTAEIAIVVEDGWQGRGLGGLLLDALLTAAEARGLRRFTADVLADNRPMLRVLSRLANIRRRELDYGVLTIEFERRSTSASEEGCLDCAGEGECDNSGGTGRQSAWAKSRSRRQCPTCSTRTTTTRPAASPGAGRSRR